MRKFGWLARWIVGCLAGAALAGCGSSIPDATAPGPVDPGLYHDAMLDNQQRLAGEDVRVSSALQNAVGSLRRRIRPTDRPIRSRISSITSRMTAPLTLRGRWPIRRSPDNQREGMLRLTDFEFARHGIYIKGYAHPGSERRRFYGAGRGAAGAEPVPRQGIYRLFLESLSDDQELVRLEAADALGNIPDPEAIPLLVVHMGAMPNPAPMCASPALKHCVIFTPSR